MIGVQLLSRDECIVRTGIATASLPSVLPSVRLSVRPSASNVHVGYRGCVVWVTLKVIIYTDS